MPHQHLRFGSEFAAFLGHSEATNALDFSYGLFFGVYFVGRSCLWKLQVYLAIAILWILSYGTEEIGTN